MARDVILDTETTGLNKNDDRIIQITAREMIGLKLTDRRINLFVNPQGKRSHLDAFEAHRISDESLLDKPTFGEAWPQVVAFIGSSRIIIHNKDFDVSMIAAECARLGIANVLDALPIEDSLDLARTLWPGKPNSLDAICRRLNISLAKRLSGHSSDVDTELTGLAYAKMIWMRENPEVQATIFGRTEVRLDPTELPPIAVHRISLQR